MCATERKGSQMMFTMRRLLIGVIGAVLVALAGSAVHAQEPATSLPKHEDMSVLLDTIRSNRRALTEVNLQLTPEQAAQFWPLYDRYQQEINAVGDRMLALIQDYIANYRTLSDEKALQLSRDYLAAETDRLAVRSKYFDEFAKILPGRTVARFFQIENKIDAVLRYDLAATIPVVEERAAPAK